MGRLPRLWLLYAVVVAAVAPDGVRAASRSLAVSVVTDRVVWLLKRVVRRPRPPRRRSDVPADFSFPSAHAANSVAFATTMSHAYPSLRAGSMATAGVIAWSRRALGHHYVSDIGAGAGVGYVVADVYQRWASAQSERGVR